MKKIHFNNIDIVSLLSADSDMPSQDMQNLLPAAYQTAIISAIGSIATHCDVKQIWVNTYLPGIGNELHNHTDREEISDHIAIFILESGNETEMFLCEDTPGVIQQHIATIGDCFIINNLEMHGLKECTNKLVAMAFVLKTS